MARFFDRYGGLLEMQRILNENKYAFATNVKYSIRNCINLLNNLAEITHGQAFVYTPDLESETSMQKFFVMNCRIADQIKYLPDAERKTIANCNLEISTNFQNRREAIQTLIRMLEHVKSDNDYNAINAFGCMLLRIDEFLKHSKNRWHCLGLAYLELAKIE